MAATKNPNRVAAGKRAWANRGKTKSRSGGKGKGRKNRRKPIQRGVTGKVGAFVLGVAPVAVAGLEAVGQSMRVKKSKGVTVFGTIQYGFIRFLNNLGNGFIWMAPFHETMTLPLDNGRVMDYKPDVKLLPKGSLLGVAVTGLTLMAFDWVASKFAGGRPVKIPMTSYNAIGGS